MKQEIIIQSVQYVDTEHEAALSAIKQELVAKVELQGKQDGSQNKPKTPAEHQALILTLIEVTLQGAIDFNQQKYLPISGVAAAKLIESEANKREQELQNEIDDLEHDLPAATNEAQKNQPDVKKMKLRKWIYAALVVIALAEGYLSYPGFRHSSFPLLPACIASIGVAVAVGFGAHFSGGYIKKAKTRLQFIRRYLVCFIPAIIGFCWLASLRARAYNHVSNLGIESQQVTAHTHDTASASAIAVISILFYWVALLLSIKYYRTMEERLQEHTYEEKCKAVQDLEKSIQDKKDEIVRVRYDKVANMTIAYKRFEYAAYQERHLANYAHIIAEAYKQKNMRHRTDGCPAFFSLKPHFNFTLFFNNNNSKPQTNEAA